MATPYRDPAEILEEVREEVAAKLERKRMKRAVFISKWGTVAGLSSVVIVLVVAFSLTPHRFDSESTMNDDARWERKKLDDEAWKNKLEQDRISGDCSLFAKDKMGDIPVRYISYFQNADGGK